MSAAGGAPWGGWITGMRCWTPTPWNGSGASPFFQNRHGWKRPTVPSPWWIPRGTLIFPPRRNAPCRCWTAPCWSSAAPTASRRTPSPFGGCWNAMACPPSCFSTKWICPVQTGKSCWNSCAPSLAAVWWILPHRRRKFWKMPPFVTRRCWKPIWKPAPSPRGICAVS